MPYLEQGNQFDRFDSRYPAPENIITRNLQVCQTPLAVFSCPSDVKPPTRNQGAIANSATSSYQGAASSYHGFAGQAVGATPAAGRFNGVFCRDNRGQIVGFRDIRDGTTNTIIVAEVKWEMNNNRVNNARIYAATSVAEYASAGTNALMINGQWTMNWTQPQGNPNPMNTAGSYHPGGAMFAFSDGSVRFISESIQHTAMAWVTNPTNPYDRANRGANYGLYQRLFSISDGLVLAGEF